MPTPSRSESPESLVRAIGTFGLAAAIVNITIGSGIFRLPSSVAGSLGAAAPVAYVICAIAMGLIVICIADAGKRVPLTGGPYAYVATAFGGYAGFLSGVLLWMLGTFASAAVATVFAGSLGALVPALGSRAMQIVMIGVALTFWALVNSRGVTLGNRLNGAATVAKLFPLVLLAVAGIFFIEPSNLTWTSTPSTSDFTRTSLLLIFAFAGIECALVPSGEVRDVERTVPRAVAIAMISITALYILLQVVAQGILGGALASATAAPLADAARASLGGWAGALLLSGATISTFGHMGGMTLSIPRMIYAFGRDGYLPRTFAQLHPGSQAPVAAILLHVTLAFALASTGTFEKLAIMGNVSALGLYLGCALASWQLRRAAGSATVAAAIVPLLACLVIAWLLTSLTRGEWIAFGACIAGATLVYFAARK